MFVVLLVYCQSVMKFFLFCIYLCYLFITQVIFFGQNGLLPFFGKLISLLPFFPN